MKYTKVFGIIYLTIISNNNGYTMEYNNEPAPYKSINDLEKENIELKKKSIKLKKNANKKKKIRCIKRT